MGDDLDRSEVVADAGLTHAGGDANREASRDVKRGGEKLPRPGFHHPGSTLYARVPFMTESSNTRTEEP